MTSEAIIAGKERKEKFKTNVIIAIVAFGIGVYCSGVAHKADQQQTAQTSNQVITTTPVVATTPEK